MQELVLFLSGGPSRLRDVLIPVFITGFYNFIIMQF